MAEPNGSGEVELVGVTKRFGEHRRRSRIST